MSLCEQQRWRLTSVCEGVCWWWGLNYILTFLCFFLVILKVWLFCLKPFHLTIIAQAWLKRWAVIAEKLRQIKEDTSHQRERAVPENKTRGFTHHLFIKAEQPCRSHHLLTSFLSQRWLLTNGHASCLHVICSSADIHSAFRFYTQSVISH